MENSISKACQELCRQAAVEHDPARLLTLFLEIDRLVDARGSICALGDNDLTTSLSVLSVACPHCWAIIELPGRRTTEKILQCPWCSEPFSTCNMIPGPEYDSRPDWAVSQYVDNSNE